MAAAASHNGGRSQVGFNFLQFGGEFAFLNFMKQAQAWSFDDNTSAPVTPDLLDSDGYPTTIIHGGVKTATYVPSQANRPGNYVIKWDGNGTISLGMSHSVVSGSKTSAAGSGRCVISTSEERFLPGISAIGSPRITNLRICHVDDEALLDAGEVFGTKFKQRLLEGGYGIIRFGDWVPMNVTNLTTWASRRAASYVLYGGHECRSSIYAAGPMTNVGTAYSVAMPGFVLADKALVTAVFNASNSSACTLNVAGTGAINILSQYSGDLSSDTNTFPEAGSFRSMATFMYDADLNAWIKFGGDLAVASMGINNGVPPELMVQLCGEVGAHPHFVMPPFAVDPMTDYVTQLATYCRDHGPAWMVPTFEPTNETWNPFFNQTGYATAKATAYGWGADVHNAYGKWTSTIGQAVSAVYGADRTRYRVLCAVQTFGDQSASAPRMTSAKYVAQVPAAQSGYTKSAAKDWVTHGCVAGYFGPSDYGQAAETTAASDYAAASTAAAKLAIATTYADTANSGSGQFRLSAVATVYSQWKAVFQGQGINKMLQYEGGYSPDYTSLGNSDVDRLRAASKGALSLIRFTDINYTNFISLSDGSFTAEWPSRFMFSESMFVGYSQQAWAILEDIYQTPNPPQFEGDRLFNARKRNVYLTATP